MVRTTVYSGPSADDTTLFMLHEGAPFVVEQEISDHLQIKLSNGKKGWIAANASSALSVRR